MISDLKCCIFLWSGLISFISFICSSNLSFEDIPIQEEGRIKPLDTFAENLATVSPSVFLGVPRIWTKFQQGILGKLFSMYRDNYIEQALILIYIGSAVSVVFSGDFITFYIFWEIMAIASTFIIWSANTNAS